MDDLKRQMHIDRCPEVEPKPPETPQPTMKWNDILTLAQRNREKMYGKPEQVQAGKAWKPKGRKS